jgi:hypothetical protein
MEEIEIPIMRKLFYVMLIPAVLGVSCTRSHYNILIPQDASSLERLAASEIRRYVYLRTGELMAIDAIGDTKQGSIELMVDEQLAEQEFMLRTYHGVLKITGGSPLGLLYGAYELAEQLGVRFYLHGDVIPDEKMPFQLPDIDIREKPLFDLRGILPFHDFPEGPDWWNEGDYKAIIGQLPKMKMNFIGFHTYPDRLNFNGQGPKAEPFVWIGKEDELNEDGTVNEAYPVLHFHTFDSTWGYSAGKTDEFLMGGGQIFETDNFGPDYMKDISLWPHTKEENIRIFNESGEMISAAFSFAGRVGVKTCTGTETPLTIPAQVRERWGIMGDNEANTWDMYRGIFKRISKAYPLDYYWLWTPESWTWQGASDAVVAKTEKDMLIAHKVLDELGKPFQLATCGWVLGPPRDRSQFDRVLPKDMPFSCINRGVGYSPVEPGFQQVSGRSKWSIPWMEDDPDLISAQLWAGRMRKDALDSWRYGCDGLFGIHWRTRMLAPNVSALAKAAWQADTWEGVQPDSLRDLPTDDFYADWVYTSFGLRDKALVDLFVRLDGKGFEAREGHKGDAPLNASQWILGPGSLMMSASLDEIREHANRYEFIPELEAYRSRIEGQGNMERFEYWLNAFRFNRAILEAAALQKELDQAIDEIQSTKSLELQQELAGEKALPLRIELASKWKDMIRILLAKISTNGEMGTLANLELHNLRRNQYLTGHDAFLRELGVILPAEAFPPKEYTGNTRVFVTTLPSIMERGEDFYLRVRVLSKADNISGQLLWRTLGKGPFNAVDLHRMARNVFEVRIPADKINEDFEYYILVEAGAEIIPYPATSNEINLSVVLLD